MQQFTARFKDKIQGIVSCFDRLLFRGSLRQLNHPHGMEVFQFTNNILFTDYEKYVKSISQRVKRASTASTQKQGPLAGRFNPENFASVSPLVG
jgi:hypothetical protein